MTQPLQRAEDPLPPGSSVTRVSLTVENLDRVARFYTHVVGLDEVDAGPGSVRLGAGDTAFLELVEAPAAKRVPNAPGLYHLAILYPSRDDLATVTARLLGLGAPFQGASDHGVSEACYLSDPEGNGIEVYRDRAPNEWPMSDGHLSMQTLPLDVPALLEDAADLETWRIPSATRLGHVHLHVTDIHQAEAFYRGILGFDLMQRYGSAASFLSAGGYHHHVAVNTWGTRNRSARQARIAGLDWFEVQVPALPDLNRLVDRLLAAQVPHLLQEGAVYVSDPSGNDLVIRDAPGSNQGAAE